MVLNVPGKRQPTSSSGFPKRLKAARLQANLTGPELATKLVLERSAVPQYEAGRVLPSMTVLQNMARVLGVSLDWLCFDEYEATDGIQDRELLTYILKVDRLSYRDRAHVKDLLENLLARVRLDELERKKPNAA